MESAATRKIYAVCCAEANNKKIQNGKKSLRGFSGGIYSITGAPGECPRRILYAAIQLQLRQIKKLNGPKFCDNSHRSFPHMNSIHSYWQIPQHPIEHLEEQFC